MAGTADIVHDDRAANFAGVVDDDVAESHQALRNGGGDGHVLDFAQRDIFGGACDQPRIDLEFGIGNRVANHVAPDVVVSRNQQKREREWNRNPG